MSLGPSVACERVEEYLVENSVAAWPTAWSSERYHSTMAGDEDAKNAGLVQLLEETDRFARDRSDGSTIQVAHKIAGWVSAGQRDSYGLRGVRDRYMADSVTTKWLRGGRPKQFSSGNGTANITVVLIESTLKHAARRAVAGEDVPTVDCHAVVMVVRVLERNHGRRPGRSRGIPVGSFCLSHQAAGGCWQHDSQRVPPHTEPEAGLGG